MVVRELMDESKKKKIMNSGKTPITNGNKQQNKNQSEHKNKRFFVLLGFFSFHIFVYNKKY